MSKISTPAEAATIPREETVFPQFLSIAEFVAATKISRQTISRKLKSGEIPYTKIGSRVLIPASFLASLEKAAWSAFDQKIG
jgi:excisionase family DNA binding protein